MSTRPPSGATQPWRGLLVQLLAVTIVPLVILVVIITLGSLALHQNAMRNMVGERDGRAVRTAAAAVDNQLKARLESISGLAMQIAHTPADQLSDRFSASAILLGEFDFGSAVFSTQGQRLASIGDQTTWDNLENTPGWATFLAKAGQVALLSQQSNFSLAGERLVVAAAPSPDEQYIVTGAFSPRLLAQHSLQDTYSLSDSTTIWIVDAQGKLIFQSGPALSAEDLETHSGVAEALAGQNGTAFTRSGHDEHVVAFSPVAALGWALLIEESWSMVTNPALETTQMAPLVAVAVLLLALLALWFGAKQIVHPLQQLEQQATELGWGNFQAIEKPVGGIAEIRRLQNELVHLSQKVQAAQQSLRGYIGAITSGQEEERRRLARELHDDTIQSLIALKQRVQLVQMDAKDTASNQSLNNLEELIEATIQNLRRLIRDLRPIYLEDLGLVTALEMATQDAHNEAQVHFQRLGAEQRLPAHTELALYRMVQEALNNLNRHAYASQAWVTVSFSTQQLELQVRDDGQGFTVPKSPAEFAVSGHYGLLGLQERAELIGARLTIASSPGQGTTLTISLPLATASRKEA